MFLRTLVRLFNRLTLLEARRRRRREKRRRRAHRIAAAIGTHSGLKVQRGPFAGLRYPSADAAGSELVPKLLGTYEAEVHPFVERIIAGGWRRVINIGCGEGYYAVGLAQRMPEARIHAFDLDVEARQQCEALARANGVADRVQVEGACTKERLRALTEEAAAIIIDCEGCELELLEPDRVPGLLGCDLLVEVHELTGANRAREVLLARFSETHASALRRYTGRDPEAYPFLAFLPPRDRRYAVDEFRSRGLEWLYLERTAADEGEDER